MFGAADPGIQVVLVGQGFVAFMAEAADGRQECGERPMHGHGLGCAHTDRRPELTQ